MTNRMFPVDFGTENFDESLSKTPNRDFDELLIRDAPGPYLQAHICGYVEMLF